MTDLERGDIATYTATVDGERKELPQVRPKGTLPPCQRCPKESPEKAPEHELSPKNWRAFAHYRQAREVGLTAAEQRDPIVRRNFGIIGPVMRDREAGRDATLQASEFARLFNR